MLFRSDEDYRHGIACLCLAVYINNARLLAYCLMSNHIHICISTEDTAAFIKAFRYPYSRYFNRKYHRKGRLGERNFFIMEIDGLHHTLTAIAYILRNPLHHGICSTPFEYEYSSVRAGFRKQLGFSQDVPLISRHRQHLYLPDKKILPKGIRMDATGLILPETIIDIADLEHLFASARSYIYYMNRLTGEDWEKEQGKDNNGHPPVKLSDIEQGTTNDDIRTLLGNEHGRASYKTMTDINLCSILDTELIPALGVASVYCMSEEQSLKTAQYIYHKYRLPKEQISRCLG